MPWTEGLAPWSSSRRWHRLSLRLEDRPSDHLHGRRTRRWRTTPSLRQGFHRRGASTGRAVEQRRGSGQGRDRRGVKGRDGARRREVLVEVARPRQDHREQGEAGRVGRRRHGAEVESGVGAAVVGEEIEAERGAGCDPNSGSFFATPATPLQVLPQPGG